MKKRIFYFIILLFLLFPIGCKKQLMDQLAEDGNYHYQNKDLGFSVILPPEFIYYQTQRTQSVDYVDLEFFIPTNDTGYPQKVPSYAKPLIVRIFIDSDWQKVLAGQLRADEYEWLGEKNKHIYTIRFWDKVPDDWTERWSNETRQFIISNFKIL